jgi:NADH:ubiquinone reductase (non-electrogenic)
LARIFTPARSYADAAPKAELSPTPPTPPTPPKKKRGKFRSILLWTWRLTYLSAIGGLIYVGYGIYEMREPPDQEYPDPAKKTLVILGETAH